MDGHPASQAGQALPSTPILYLSSLSDTFAAASCGNVTLLLRQALRHGYCAAAFAVAGDMLVNLVAQALEGLVQGIEIRGDNAEQRLAFRPAGAQFDLTAA